MEPGTQLAAINGALANWLAEDDRVLLLGEDIRSPYGGAFKVTRGLSNNYPDRVLNTPISEAGIVGVANGLALGGGGRSSGSCSATFWGSASTSS